MLSEYRIKKYFNLAKKASNMSDYMGNRRIRIGSVLVYKNKVVATGWNTSKTSVLQAEYNELRGFDPMCFRNVWHSEMLCLHRAEKLGIDFSRAALFVYREKCNGAAGMAKPCAACDAFIRKCGVKHIYYTTDKGWAYEYIKY